MRLERTLFYKSVMVLLATAVSVASTALASSARTESDEASVYLQTHANFPLYTLSTQANGQRIMIADLHLPPQSTIAVQIGFLSHQLALQEQSPEQVNYNFAVQTSAHDSDVYQSKEGWVCGVRIVRMADDKLRASKVLNFQNYCFQNTQWPQLLVSGNDKETQNALRAYILRKDSTSLQALARVAQDAALERQISPVETKRLTSPLKGCLRSTGCLSGAATQRGVNFRAHHGQVVLAAADGRVVSIDRHGKWSTLVILHADQRLESVSGLLVPNTVIVKAGQDVKQGQALGRVLNHLHFEIRQQGMTRDPRSYL